MPNCQHCGTPGAMNRCTRCRQVSYCDRNCQRQDWSDHKPFCHAMATGTSDQNLNSDFVELNANTHHRVMTNQLTVPATLAQAATPVWQNVLTHLGRRDNTPVRIVPRHPELCLPFGRCHHNVELRVNEYGGRAAVGWNLLMTSQVLEAEAHAIWQDRDGKFWDVTADPEGHTTGSICFWEQDGTDFTAMAVAGRPGKERLRTRIWWL